MSKRNVRLLLDDILSSIAKIERYVDAMDQEQFLDDEKTTDAVVRNIEIIGGATRQLPTEFTAAHPDIPWSQMAGLRNRIVHEYFGLDLEIIWTIIEQHLLVLQKQLQLLFDQLIKEPPKG
jgi:uncharacterized protein with HEPN domain